MRIWYEKSTGSITASAKSDRIRSTRVGEELLEVAQMDLGQLGEYKVMSGKIVKNPDFVEPKPPQNLAVEIDALKARIKALETM